MNATTSYGDDDASVVYIATGIAHIILVIIPCLIFGLIVLCVFIPRFKKNKSPSSLMFIFISMSCIVTPSTSGMLTNINLITNIPVFGDCSTATSTSLIFAFLGFGNLFLLALTALFSVQLYMSLRGFKKNMLKFSILLTLISLFVGLAAALSQFIDDPYGVNFVELRGSYCLTTDSKQLDILNVVAAVVAVTIVFPSIVTVIVFSILSYKHIKQNVIENGGVLKSSQKIFISIVVAFVIFRIIPVFIVFVPLVNFDANVSAAFFFSAVYSVELSYPIYLLLIVCVHKTVKEELKKKLKSLSLSVLKKDTSVLPSDSSTG